MINVDLENINRFFGGKISRVNFLPVRDPIISARTQNSLFPVYIQALLSECRVEFYNLHGFRQIVYDLRYDRWNELSEP